MSVKAVQFSTSVMQYCIDTSVSEHKVLRAIRLGNANHPQGHMMLDPLQGQMLTLLLQLMGAKRTLDIGVFTGYSSLLAALAVPATGQVIAIDTDEQNTAIAQQYWQQAGVADKISLNIGPALSTLAALIENGEQASFDFACIDADKANYDTYYEQCLTLCRPSGLLALDNMLDAGKVADPSIQTERVQRFRHLSDKIHHDQRVTACLLPIGDGLLLAHKN
jgi:predicted O-methyltransferase YrrM